MHDSKRLTEKSSKLVEEGVKTIEYQKIKMNENKQAAENVNRAMSILETRSKEISEIIEVINGLSE